MYSIFEANFYGVKGSIFELAPLVAKHGIGGINVPAEVLEDKKLAREAAKCVYDNGLQWNLLPTAADFLHYVTPDEAFDRGIETFKRWAETAEIMGVKRCYNHVVPGNNERPYDENYEWNVRRASQVFHICNDHGIQYGLEFIGPYHLQHTDVKYPFFNSLAGVLAIADAIDPKVGFVFDTYHWYCNGGRMDDLYYAARHVERMVSFHVNDGIAGRTREQQMDLERAMPMTTGVIDAKAVFDLFDRVGYAGPCMCEPIYPTYYKYEKMTAEEAIMDMAAAYRRLWHAGE